MGVRPFLLRNTASVQEGQVSAIDRPEVRGSVPGQGGPAREAAALLLFALSVFLCLGLGSLQLDPYDPSVAGPDWVGPVGAFVAATLVQGFGVVAWWAPLELALVGAPLFRGRPVGSVGLRLGGDLVVAVVLAALVQVLAPTSEAFGAARASGNVGLLFGELMRGLFSTAGTVLVSVTVVGLILIGRSSFSFIEWCQRVSWAFKRCSAWLFRTAGRLHDVWRQARELRRERAAARAASAEPLIDTLGRDDAIIAELTAEDPAWFPEMTGTPPVALARDLADFDDAADAADSATEDDADDELDAAEDDADDAATLDADDEAALADAADSDADAESSAAPEVAAAAELPVTKARAPRGSGANESDANEAAPGARASRAKSKAPVGPKIVDTQPERRVERDGAAQASAPARRRAGQFQLPNIELLDVAEPMTTDVDRARVLEHAAQLEKTLADYGVAAKVQEIHPGPTVTTYEVVPEAGTKVSKVASLSDDLALGLSRKVRIIAPIPGKKRIGFELPNDKRIPVNLRELIEDRRFGELAERVPLPVVLGRDIVGAPFYADLASMPHVIVAGATGAGKSVGLNVMLSSLLFKRTPEELRFLMIDPKVVELAPFDGIPHLLLPVVTDMKKAATALKWAVDEMERRYQAFANAGTRNISSYNQWVERVIAGEIALPAPAQVEALTADGDVVSVAAAKDGSDGQALPEKLPFIVIVVDEFADLMMQQGKEVEVSVARLAQKARAAGMHVVLATQRPSVDVITGMIKANFPSRIAFRVAQKVDSRTILDEQGAELLLGKGDMLVKTNGASETRRVQCPFVSEAEVSALTDYLRSQGAPTYHEAILKACDDDEETKDADEDLDPRFDEAVRIVAETQRCSTSWLQRKMTIGYNRAAKIVEAMETRGIVGPPNGSKDREVYAHGQ